MIVCAIGGFGFSESNFRNSASSSAKRFFCSAVNGAVPNSSSL